MLLVVETRSDIRGEIARTSMYMYSVYPGRGIISKKNRNLFDKWECERAERIEKILGNRNEIVMGNC